MSNHFQDPIISVIIPCRNEEYFIEKCILSILNQKEIKGLEILVVDGMSVDNTRSVLTSLSVRYENVKIFNNPNKTTPQALNIGIKNSKGKFICIMGAHSEYDEYFLTNGLKLLNNNPAVSCVGGPILSIGQSNFGKAVALAMSSSIGVGNAKHRFPNYEGYAEMACFPIFRKEVFSQIGLYDESFIRNQDDEFCLRLNKNGGKVFISPKVRSYYYVRENIKSLFTQYYNYGFWRIAVIRKHKMTISFRQLIPFLFFFTSFNLFIFFLITENIMLGVALPLLYLVLIFFYSINVFCKYNLITALIFPSVVFTLHFSYAIGFLVGIFKFGFRNPSLNH